MSAGGQGSGFGSPSGSYGSSYGGGYGGNSYSGYGQPQNFPQFQQQNGGYPNRFAAFGQAPSGGMGDSGGTIMDAGMPSSGMNKSFGQYASFGGSGNSMGGDMMDAGMPSSFPSMNGNGMGNGSVMDMGMSSFGPPGFGPVGMGGMGNGMSDIMSAPPSQPPQVSAPQAPQAQGMYQPQGNGAPAGYTYDQNGSLISNALAAQAGVQPNYGNGAPQQPQQPDPSKVGNFGQNTGQSWLYGPTAGMFGAARPPGTPNSYWFNQNAGQWGPLTPQVR